MTLGMQYLKHWSITNFAYINCCLKIFELIFLGQQAMAKEPTGR